jgi:hypothetical protein
VQNDAAATRYNARKHALAARTLYADARFENASANDGFSRMAVE